MSNLPFCFHAKPSPVDCPLTIYVKTRMQETKLFEKWTLQGLLDELDTVELLESPECGRVLGEITQKQKDIYAALGIREPSL